MYMINQSTSDVYNKNQLPVLEDIRKVTLVQLSLFDTVDIMSLHVRMSKILFWTIDNIISSMFWEMFWNTFSQPAQLFKQNQEKVNRF